MVVLVLAVGASLVVPGSAARAQDTRLALADGTWRGTMGAAGVFTGSDADAFVIWNGSLDGSFLFLVVSGQINGSWEWEGSADVDVSTPEGDVPMSLDTVAVGTMSGAADRLRLEGAETTTGSGSFMGMTVPLGPNTTPLDPIDVRFTEVGCNAVFGDWTTALTDMASQDGLSGVMSGWFIATPSGPTAPGAQFTVELEARYADLEQRILLALFGGSAMLTGNGLLQAFDLLEEAVQLEAEAAELDGTCAYDIQGGPFATPLTSRLATTLLRMVPGLTPTQLFSASQLLVAVGGAGGAASRALADDLEAAVAQQAQELHDLYVTTTGVHPDGRSCSVVDPCVLAFDEVLQLHLAASLLGFGLDVDGVPVTLATLLEGR